MEITFTTPALLFPALSLLLLAYTNRFLALAALTRELITQYKSSHEARIKMQLVSLQYRINIIKQTQAYGVASFFGGVLCTFLLFAGLTETAKWVFGGSLILMLLSLTLSLREVLVSIDTLKIALKDIEE
jgi:hypothetical protein